MIITDIETYFIDEPDRIYEVKVYNNKLQDYEDLLGFYKVIHLLKIPKDYLIGISKIYNNDDNTWYEVYKDIQYFKLSEIRLVDEYEHVKNSFKKSNEGD